MHRASPKPTPCDLRFVKRSTRPAGKCTCCKPYTKACACRVLLVLSCNFGFTCRARVTDRSGLQALLFASGSHAYDIIANAAATTAPEEADILNRVLDGAMRS